MPVTESTQAQAAQAAQEWVALADVARPHGVRGELRLRVYNPESDLLLHQKEVQLQLASGQTRLERVTSARRANDAILMQLASVSDRDVADSLRGAAVAIPRAAFERLDDDEFYAVDVIGSRAVELLESGESVDVGAVKDFVSYPSVDVFVIEHEGQTLDVPSTEAFVVSVQPGLVQLHGLDVLREIAESSKPKPKAPRPPRPPRAKR